ncbi:MAG: hypothetical protein A2542_01950 [Parcubacteria group bacterium RIFOXYD2_FULL_52_8]|nr:MAG: hypothetical protein A2542_01950 [Parcubacteria group bacterium RIFOXYD2_FULL_52_8]
MEPSKPLIVGGIALVIVVGLIAWYQSTRPVTEEIGTGAATSTVSSVPLTINAKHLYVNGTHTYRGVIETPTPCYDVLATSTPTLGGEYSILITTKERGGACAQMVTSKEFAVSFQAPEDVLVLPQLNGKPAQFNIVEVTSEEDLRGPFDFKS